MKVHSAPACSSQLTSSCSSLNSRRAAAPFIRSSSFASCAGAGGSFAASGSGQDIARLETEACDNVLLGISTHHVNCFSDIGLTIFLPYQKVGLQTIHNDSLTIRARQNF